NGEITSEMYKRVVIKLQPDDQVTVMGRVNEPGGYSIKRHELNTAGLSTLDINDYTASTIEINGRPLVSETLKIAHRAMQNLIFDGVLPIPEKEQFTMATNVMRINQWMVDHARK